MESLEFHQHWGRKRYTTLQRRPNTVNKWAQSISSGDTGLGNRVRALNLATATGVSAAQVAQHRKSLLITDTILKTQGKRSP